MDEGHERNKEKGGQEDEKRIITRIVRNKTIQTITCFTHERKRSRYSLSFTTIRIRRMCDCLSFTF